MAGASWCEDFVYQAGFAVGEWLHRELLLYCFETSCWKGKRLTRCLRPRCSSNSGGSTTTRSDRTAPWDTGPRPPNRFPAVAVSSNASSSSRYASTPASLVTLHPKNVSFKVQSKSTRKSHVWQSHSGFPFRREGIGRKFLGYRVHAQNPCQSRRGHLENAGV